MDKATLGGGCFWCLEAVFVRLRGVDRVISGYAGGHPPDPDYEMVCSGRSGHAEVVQITFDPMQISYAQLLQVFFKTHDPTTLNRQGNDVGTQYRSVIFTHNEAQRRIALEVIAAMAPEFPRPMVTELLPLPVFYPAEEGHQDYFARHPGQPYCAYVVAPKVDKLERVFGDLLKSVDR